MKIEAKKISERTYIVNDSRFTRGVNRKYYRNTKLKTDLHRYLWILNFGEIPEGYDIHHKDEDTENNSIDNLECIENKKHLSLHSKKRSKEFLEKIQPLGAKKAKEWHKSNTGKEWHKKHYEKMKDKLYIEKEYTCECCGKKFTTTKANSRFCSNSCKSKWRRDNGIDNEKRVCLYCGKEFEINKYSKTKFCSKSCAKKMSWKLKCTPTL